MNVTRQKQGSNMDVPRSARCLLAAIPITVLLGSCGGGGSSGSAAATTPPGGTGGSGWVQGQFSPESTFAAQCVAPRTGTDPVSSKPYPDKKGTLLDQLNWLRSWTNDLYLWYSEVTDQNPANFSSDASYFAV